MENASKALLMAGSILIALMVIGVLVLMFNNLSYYKRSSDENIKQAQIIEFNNQFETFNRPEVRGTELYSLLNKVVDYNRRKSEVATGDDQGQDIRFEPMTIIVDFPDDNIMKDNWTFDNIIRLFKSPIITKTGSKNQIKLDKWIANQFETELTSLIKELENAENEPGKKYYGGKVGIANLSAGISNLFPTAIDRETEEKSIQLYLRNTKKLETFDNINKRNGTIYNDICTYYEYVQFKRAYFDCTYVRYNNNTGRIIEMQFKYNPDKIE